MEAWEMIPKINGFDMFFENIDESAREKYTHYGEWKNYVKVHFKG